MKRRLEISTALEGREMECCPVGKIPYETRHAAIKAMRRIGNRKGGYDGIEAYQCEHCERWHLRRLERAVCRKFRRK